MSLLSYSIYLLSAQVNSLWQGFSTCGLRGTQNLSGGTRQATIESNVHAYLPKKRVVGVQKFKKFYVRGILFKKG